MSRRDSSKVKSKCVSHQRQKQMDVLLAKEMLNYISERSYNENIKKICHDLLEFDCIENMTIDSFMIEITDVNQNYIRNYIQCLNPQFKDINVAIELLWGACVNFQGISMSIFLCFWF